MPVVYSQSAFIHSSWTAVCAQPAVRQSVVVLVCTGGGRYLPLFTVVVVVVAAGGFTITATTLSTAVPGI